MRLRLLLVFIGLGLGRPVLAQETAIEDLIRQLGSEQFNERDHASRALERLGEKALAALEAATRAPDLETSRRARLLQRKVKEHLLAKQILEPRRVELKLAGNSLAALAQQVESQTGVPHKFEAEGAGKVVALDTGSVSVWQALAEFRCVLGLSLSDRVPPPSVPELQRDSAYPAEGTFVLTKRKVAVVPEGESGPLFLRALPRPDDWNQNVAFLLQIAPDPKAGMQGIDGIRFTKLLDVTGLPGSKLQAAIGTGSGVLEQLGPRASQEVEPGQRRPCFVVPITKVPGKVTEKYQEIQGLVAARFLVKTPVLVVDGVAKAIGRNYVEPGGAALQVMEVETLDDGDFYVRLQLEDFETLVQNQPGPRVVRPRPGFVAFRGPADQAADCIELMDARGRHLPRVKASSRPLANKALTGVELQLTFQAPANPEEPLRLVFSTFHPLAVDVPFTLRNVTVP